MLGFSISPEDLKVFLEELDEQLQALESHILALEKETTPLAVKEIFRIAHTIKGSAASIGLETVARLTHAMESVFDAVREGRLEISREIVNLLFRCLDILNAHRRGIETKTPAKVDASPVQAALEALVKKKTEPSGGLYEIEARFAEDCDIPSVRAFQLVLELQKFGEIESSSPTSRQIEEGFNDFKIFTASFRARSDINQVKNELSRISELADLRIREAPSRENPAQGEEQDIVRDLKEIRTVRVDVDVLDGLLNLVGELVIDKTRLLHLGADLERWGEAGVFGHEISSTTQHLGKITADLQTEIMKARLVPLKTLFGKFPRMVRDLADRSGKEIQLVLEGEDLQLDRAIIEEIGDPLIHLLRNCVDHGIEDPEERTSFGKGPAGLIRVRAFHEENYAKILVEDDGGGIDPEKIRRIARDRRIMPDEKLKDMPRAEVISLIFLPGFSTVEKVTDVSGRGVGMDIVKANLQKIGGTIEVDSDPGHGTAFTLKIPLTLAILQVLLVSHSETVFAIPLTHIREIVEIRRENLKTIGGREVIVLRGQVVPLLWIGEIYGKKFPAEKETYQAVVLANEDTPTGILVDDLVEKQEVVIKNLGSFLGDVPGISGATVLGNGTVGLILDVPAFVNLVHRHRRSIFKRAS